jgi:hypothetical protein
MKHGNSIVINSAVRLLFWSLVALAISLGILISPATADQQVIDRWAIWGPGWGRGGLAANSPNYEKYLSPQPGDMDFSIGTDKVYLYPWKIATSADGLLKFPTFLKSEIAQSWNAWAGGCIYAHTYLNAAMPMSVDLNVQSIVPAEGWLNGRKMTSHSLQIQQGWNHLLLKIHSPIGIGRPSTPTLSEKDWWMRAFLSSESANLKHIIISPYEPTRKTPAIQDKIPLPLRYLSTLSSQSGQFPIFTGGQAVFLNYALRVAYGFADNVSAMQPAQSVFIGQPWVYSSISQPSQNQPLPVVNTYQKSEWAKALPKALHIKIFNDQDQGVMDTIRTLSFQASQRRSPLPEAFSTQIVLSLGALPMGHYTMRVDFLNQDGTLQAHDRDHSFAVIWGPIVAKFDTAPRRLSCVHPWLIENLTQTLLHFQWLHTVGVTRQHKLSAAWSTWGATLSPDGTVVVKSSPKVDQALKAARKWGITVVGNLEMGWLDLDRYHNTQHEDQEKSPPEQRVGSLETPLRILSLREPGGARLPPYDTRAFEKVLRDYAVQIVSRYQGQIQVWTGSNEIDLQAGPATNSIARMYADATRILYQSLKKANPKAAFVGPSLALRSDFTDTLFKYGFAEHADILDVHEHPAHAPSLSDPTLGGGRGGLAVIPSDLKNHASTKPVWYGEISAPLAHSPDGVWGQAEAIVKQLSWAIKHPQVASLSYLVMNNQPSLDRDTGLGFNNCFGDPHPVVNAMNVASHLLDGHGRLPDLKELPQEIQQLRVKARGGQESLVLWSDRERPLELKVSDNTVIHVDLFGRRHKLFSRHNTIRLTVSHTPQYLIGKFG